MAKITIPAANIEYDCIDDTIMRAAARAGLGFPYECNVGECGNCRFELLEGEVTYLRQNPPGVTERDAQRNRYLGCQALPNGDCKIKVPLRDHYKSKHLPKKTTGELFETLDVTHDGTHGGTRDGTAVEPDDLVATARADARRLLGDAAGAMEVRASIVTRWRGALTRPVVGRAQLLAGIDRQLTLLPGLALTGSAVAGNGLAGVVGRSAREATRTL